MKTYMASASTIERKWYVVDAADYTLGRLASQVAAVLRGKNKPTYTPFLDCGDNVIVINADKVIHGPQLGVLTAQPASTKISSSPSLIHCL